jgi:hypothetical protein
MPFSANISEKVCGEQQDLKVCRNSAQINLQNKYAGEKQFF